MTEWTLADGHPQSRSSRFPPQWLLRSSTEMHHERAQIPYLDITGMCLAPDMKISGHIHGRPKCQISLKLACFSIPVAATTPNFLRRRTLPGTKYMATYGLLHRIQCAAARDRPVGAHMDAYGPFLYGAAAGLKAHMVTYGLFLYGAPAGL